MISTDRRTWAKAEQNAESMRQITLAVVGAPRSGKSTFVQHALDLKKLPTSRISAKKVSLEGIVSTLRIHEIDTHEIEITSQGTPCWAPVDEDENASNVDGVLIIYSISDLASTKPVPALLSEFHNLPALSLATLVFRKKAYFT